MDLLIAIPLILLMAYALAYGYVYPRACGGSLRRLAMADVVTTAAVLVVLWAYVQRGDQHYVSLAGGQWHWLWYAVPLMLLIEGLAWTLYVRFISLDWREALGPAGDDGGNDADTNHEDDDRDEDMPPDLPPHRAHPAASAVPARLHVLLAAQAPRAVILRRGPAKEVATFSWNLENDEIQLGQWLRGRIYERRSDLSPDGQFLLYFAMDGRWDGPAQGAYSAISRAPFLKALTLLPKGDCWHGGGLWLGDDQYWLNDGYGHSCLRDESPCRRVTQHPFATMGNDECLGVYYLRLQRDGWQREALAADDPRTADTRWSKACGEQRRLIKLCHAGQPPGPGRGVYWDTHHLIDQQGKQHWPADTAEWAEVVRGRLLWAAAGCLWAAPLDAPPPWSGNLIRDCNADSFTRVRAPY